MDDQLMDMLGKVNVKSFRWLKEFNDEGPFDIVFVEGAVSTPEEVELVKKLREKSKILVALGDCAAFGGVPAIRDFMDQEDVRREVYGDYTYLESIEATAIGEHVKVDYMLRGCPIDKSEFLSYFNALVNDERPVEKRYAVCLECKRNGNKCLLKDGIPCIGPITLAGCNSACPNVGVPCFGCRGPTPNASLIAVKSMFETNGVDFEGIKDIKERIIEFMGRAKFVRE